MTFEEQLASLNEFYFFREFTFARTTFKPQPEQELELADNLVWLDKLLFVYQLKERQPAGTASPETEKNWYERKVLGKATKQIRDSLEYIRKNGHIEITNLRGHSFELSGTQIQETHKIIVYNPHLLLPDHCLSQKFHESGTAGLIHIIPAHDYLGILRVLLTPAEVSEYLRFREILALRFGERLASVSEQALVGQYIAEEPDALPHRRFEYYLEQLRQDVESWDISRIIKLFPDRQTTPNMPTDYYPIVTELAKLTRMELGKFKERFVLSMDRAKTNSATLPYRFVAPRTGCGFVFVPVQGEMKATRRNALVNFTRAHKYDQKLRRCIGVSLAAAEGGWFDVEWCYLDFEWVEDVEIAEILQRNSPFREVKRVRIPRYTFH
jgi:hypothetical protein